MRGPVTGGAALVVPVYTGAYGPGAVGPFRESLALLSRSTGLPVVPLAVLPPAGLREALERHLAGLRLSAGVRRVGVLLVDREAGAELAGFTSPLPVDTRLAARHARVVEGEFGGRVPGPGGGPLDEGARFIRRFARTSHAVLADALDLVAEEPRQPRLAWRDPRAPVVALPSGPDCTGPLSTAVASLGGWEGLLDRREEVVVKPNLHYHEQYPSTTRPEALAEVIRQLLARDYRVRVAESSGPDTLNCAHVAGLLQVCDGLGVPFSPVEMGDCVTLATGFDPLPYVDMFRVFVEARNLVCLGLLKTHQVAGLTAASKHLFGAVSNRARLAVHRAAAAGDFEPLHRLIAFVNRVITPAVTIIDAYQGLLGGPGFFTDRAVVTAENLLLAGRDNLALDLWIRDYLDRRHPGWNPSLHPTVDYLEYLLQAGN